MPIVWNHPADQRHPIDRSHPVGQQLQYYFLSCNSSQSYDSQFPACAGSFWGSEGIVGSRASNVAVGRG